MSRKRASEEDDEEEKSSIKHFKHDPECFLDNSKYKHEVAGEVVNHNDVFQEGWTLVSQFTHKKRNLFGNKLKKKTKKNFKYHKEVFPPWRRWKSWHINEGSMQISAVETPTVTTYRNQVLAVSRTLREHVPVLSVFQSFSLSLLYMKFSIWFL